MKKINIMVAAMAVALGFSACNETWDDNPTLGTHEGNEVKNFLNTPEMANMAVDITEENASEVFHLTCSQPTEYGYAASVAYQMEVALNADFTTPAVEGAPATVVLGTVFKNCAEINPTRQAIAEAMCKMLDITDEAQLPTAYMPVYMRLIANVVNENGKEVPGTTFTSNIVSFKEVRCSYLAIVVPDLPTGIYVRGNLNGWLNSILQDTPKENWTEEQKAELAKYEFLTTSERNVYELAYVEIPADDSFKIADMSWGAPNLGVNDAGAPTFGEKYEFGWNTSDIKLTSAFVGSITLTGSDKNWSMVMYALEEDTPGQPSGIYLRGVGGNWDAESDMEFKTTNLKGIWEIARVTIPGGGDGFKVADATWSDLNFGAHLVDGAVAPIVPGANYALEKGGTNIPINDPFTGKVTLRQKGNAYTLILEAD